MSTIQTLRAELARRRGDWPAMCQATGLSYWWLIKFAQGRIREPGLSKIETLQRFFEANPLAASAGDGPPEPPAHRSRAGWDEGRPSNDHLVADRVAAAPTERVA